MDRIPLFFSHAGLVAGRGFIARVVIEGRCILERTADDFVTFLGVNPGAAAGQGATQEEAYHNLADHIRLVVFDLAAEARDFSEFRRLVEGFVLQTSSSLESFWRSAVEDVRAGRVDRSAFSRVFDADRPASVSVALVADQHGEQAPEPTLALGPELNPQEEEQPLLVAVG